MSQASEVLAALEQADLFNETPSPLAVGPRRVFISARVSTDIGTIRQALHDLDCHVISIDELVRPGSLWIQSIFDGIRQADFIVAVLDGDGVDANVYYEGGAAEALGKRVLWMVPPHQKFPNFLSERMYLSADATREAIDLQLKMMMGAPLPIVPTRPKSPPTTRPIGDRADEFLARLHDVRSSSEAILASIVADALRATGASPIVEAARHPSTTARFDLAIWSNDLMPWFGNPFPLELEARLTTPEQYHEAVDRFRRQLAASGLDSGAILVGSGGLPDFVIEEDHPSKVVIGEVGAFIELLRRADLSTTLRQLGRSSGPRQG